MNRIDRLFKNKNGKILSVYFTAGFPLPESTAGIIKTLASEGVDMIEIGIPFSDPMADGPVIQQSNQSALNNGMSLKTLFSQLEGIRNEVDIPLLLMGYLNPVLQFGVENFCRKASETGIDGVILPDLPPMIYSRDYQSVFEKYNLYNILLISPLSDDERIRYIDSISRGFVYMVSSSSVTGGKNSFSDDQINYFRRVNDLKLKNPAIIGFGISDNKAFSDSCRYAGGGIIGSAFVKVLGMKGNMDENIRLFVRECRS